MTELFDANARAIIVPVLVVGPRTAHRFRFALDTGANVTSMRSEYLRLLGYDPAAVAHRRLVRSATGATRAPILTVSRLVSLGQVRTDFPIVVLDPPPALTADGLLGLDFYHVLVLKLDFARGRVGLRRPGPWWRFWS